MTPELKQKILDRLRSEPEENHATRRLREGCRFCALGLIADTCGVTWIDDWIWYKGVEYGGCLPYELRWSIGITESDEDAILDLNDDEGKSFAEIADYIEANW